MFQDVLPLLDKNARILEIGCNAGRNLNYLYQKGYKSLTGIEIGIEAEEVMKGQFPDACKSTRYILGNAYEELVKLSSSHYDLVFSRAVLVNIAPKWNAIFREMARVSNSYILLMESEDSYLSCPRDFEKVFRKMSYRQILYKFFTLSKHNGLVLAPDFVQKGFFKAATLRLFVPIQNS